MKDNIFRTSLHQDDTMTGFHDDVFQMTDTNPTHPTKGWPGDEQKEEELRKQNDNLNEGDMIAEVTDTVIIDAEEGSVTEIVEVDLYPAENITDTRE